MKQPVKKKDINKDIKKDVKPAEIQLAPKNPVWNYLVNAWIFIPAVMYYAVVSQNVVNIPIMDDYEAILQFLLNFKSASFGEKLALMFSQHAEHRLLFSRIVYVTYYTLFGHVNFKHIIFIADLQLLAIFLV